MDADDRDWLESRFESVLVRINEASESQRQESYRMHRENSARLDISNNKVSKLEGIVEGLQAEWTIIRKRYHELMADLQKAVLEGIGGLGGEDSKSVTRFELKFIGVLAASVATFTAGMILWVLKMTGKL